MQQLVADIGLRPSLQRSAVYARPAEEERITGKIENVVATTGGIGWEQPSTARRNICKPFCRE